MSTTRRLPNFLIIGAAKAGTTSLYAYLKQHPQIFMPAEKEIRFFKDDALYSKGLDWYANLFAGATQPAAGEATPSYLHEPKVARRIFESLPGVKLIILLREPISRTYSHYWNKVRGGWESRPFREVVESAVIQGHDEIIVRASLYGMNVGRYAELFPRENILIEFSSNLTRQPEQILSRICAHLGIDSFVPEGVDRKHNTATSLRLPWFTRRIKSRSASKSLVKSIVPFQTWRILKKTITRLNYKPFAYPEMDAESRTLLSELFARDREILAKYVETIPWSFHDSATKAAAAQ